MLRLQQWILVGHLFLRPVYSYDCICNDGVAFYMRYYPIVHTKHFSGVAFYGDCFFYDGTLYNEGEKFLKTHLNDRVAWFWMNASFYEPHLENCSNPIRDIDDGSANVNCLYLFVVESLYKEPKKTEQNIIAELPPCRNYIDCPHLNSNETIQRNNDSWFNVTYKDKATGYVLAERTMRWHCGQYVEKDITIPSEADDVILDWVLPVGVISALLLITLPTSIFIYYRRRRISIDWKESTVKQDYEAKPTEFDVFISYSRDDYEWVKTLFFQLKSEGFDVCVDFKDFVPGETVSENIMNAIYKSRKTVVVMSKNFLNSVWGQFEMQQALCKSIAQRQDTLILVKFGECKVPRKLMGKTFLDWTSVKEKQYFWQRLNKAIGH